MSRELIDLPDIQVAYHESGHAAWAISIGRAVDRISRERELVAEPNVYCLGVTKVSPDFMTGTMKYTLYLLSGIAGEEVGAETHGYSFSRDQLEWEWAAQDLWAQYRYEGRGGEVYDSGWARAKLPAIYEPLLEEMRQNRLLPILAKALKDKPTMNAEEVALIAAEHPLTMVAQVRPGEA